jgi:hypothetical protein
LCSNLYKILKFAIGTFKASFSVVLRFKNLPDTQLDDVIEPLICMVDWDVLPAIRSQVFWGISIVGFFL